MGAKKGKKGKLSKKETGRGTSPPTTRRRKKATRRIGKIKKRKRGTKKTRNRKITKFGS